MSQEQTNRIADIVLCDVRDHKTLDRVRALLDGRLVIWPEDLQAALTGSPPTMEEDSS